MTSHHKLELEYEQRKGGGTVQNGKRKGINLFLLYRVRMKLM